MNRPRNQYTDWNKVPLILDTSQAANLLQVTREHVSDLCKRGELPAMQLGSKWHISREAIRERLDGKPAESRQRNVGDAPYYV